MDKHELLDLIYDALADEPRAIELECLSQSEGVITVVDEQGQTFKVTVVQSDRLVSGDSAT